MIDISKEFNKSRLEKMNFIIQNYPELKYIFQENNTYSTSLEVIKSNIDKYSPEDGKELLGWIQGMSICSILDYLIKYKQDFIQII